MQPLQWEQKGKEERGELGWRGHKCNGIKKGPQWPQAVGNSGKLYRKPGPQKSWEEEEEQQQRQQELELE